jgi:hypothetical protein
LASLATVVNHYWDSFVADDAKGATEVARKV